MSRLSVLIRALIVGIFLSQAACTVCGTRSEDSQNKGVPVTNKTPDVSARPSIARPRTVERVVLSLRDGTEHTAILSIPKDYRAPLPAIIVLGGFETGEKALDFLREDLNVIYATTDYPYKAPKQRGFLNDLNELSVIRNAVWRTDLAVDALIERLQSDSRVDLEKVSFVGASFGAPFAITAAVRNAEVDGLILLHGFGRVDLAIARQLVNEWGGWSRPLAWFLGQLAWAYLGYNAPEAEVQKLRSSQHVFYIYSDDDEQIPCESVESLRKALESSHAQVMVIRSEGGHLGPDRTEIINKLTDMSIEWLKAQRLL